MSGTQSNDSQQSIDALLFDFCGSESLSEDGLREIFQRYGCAPNNNLNRGNCGFLHQACQNERVTEGILRCLLEYFPDAVWDTCSGEGMTPLHYLCNNKNATLGMVQLLIEECPESLRRADNNGGNPLHMLCLNKNIDDTAALDILGLLLERCPEAVRRTENNHGALPIHVAAIISKSPEFCRMLIEAYPGSERIATVGGFLPLHIACGTNNVANVALVEYLLELYPESIYVANPDVGGGYPIHYAILGLIKKNNPAAAVEMVQLLIDHDSNVALQKLENKFPLYTTFCSACNNQNNPSIFNAAMKILQLFYDAHPEVIEDDQISTILGRRDLAIPEEIQTFINAQLNYARQVRNSTARQMTMRDENGQVPLHRALRDNFTLGSIKLLVKRNPSVILTPDNDGALPLHVACQHNDSSKVVDYLICLDPTTLTAVDGDGNTALHLACRGAKYDTIALLLEKYGAISVSQSNALNKLPIHLLFESDAVSNREDDTKYLESVFQLLRAYPETVMLPGDEKQQTTRYGGRPSRSGKKRKYCA